MIHYVSDGDIPIVGATVLSLGDGDAWAPVAPAGLHDMAAVDVSSYEERGVVGEHDHRPRALRDRPRAAQHVGEVGGVGLGHGQEQAVTQHAPQCAVHGPRRPGQPVAGDDDQRAVGPERVLEHDVDRARRVRGRGLRIVHPERVRARRGDPAEPSGGPRPPTTPECHARSVRSIAPTRQVEARASPGRLAPCPSPLEMPAYPSTCPAPKTTPLRCPTTTR